MKSFCFDIRKQHGHPLFPCFPKAKWLLDSMESILDTTFGCRIHSVREPPFGGLKVDVNNMKKLEWLVVWSRKAKSARTLKILAMCLAAGTAVLRYWSLTARAQRMYVVTVELLLCILYIQVTVGKLLHHTAIDWNFSSILSTEHFNISQLMNIPNIVEICYPYSSYYLLCMYQSGTTLHILFALSNTICFNFAISRSITRTSKST